MRRIRRDPARIGRTHLRDARLTRDLDWLHDLFEPVGPVSIRLMFGGAGIYRDGRMFALVAGGEIFLKSDKALEPRFRAARCRPFVYGKGGKAVAMSYWSLPEAALDDAEALKDWAEAALQAARRAAQPRRAR